MTIQLHIFQKETQNPLFLVVPSICDPRFIRLKWELFNKKKFKHIKFLPLTTTKAYAAIASEKLKYHLLPHCVNENGAWCIYYVGR